MAMKRILKNLQEDSSGSYWKGEGGEEARAILIKGFNGTLKEFKKALFRFQENNVSGYATKRQSKRP